MGAERADNRRKAERLFACGDPAFVDVLNDVTDAAWLRALAPHWFAEGSAAAREFLLAYLDGPLNPFHEPLVLELLALAEGAGDDELMGAFLVLFDRSVWRRWVERPGDGRREWVLLPFAADAPRGQVIGSAYVVPGPGRDRVLFPGLGRIQDYEAGRLFRLTTRLVCRRRVGGYFRRLGRLHPDRYVPAVVRALKRYQFVDMADGVDLLSNRNLLKILYFHSPVRKDQQKAWPTVGWLPAPLYEELWLRQPGALLEVMKDSPASPVFLWAMRLLRRRSREVLAALPLEELLGLLRHTDSLKVYAAAEVLHSRGGLEEISVERWLEILHAQQGDGRELVGELLARRLEGGGWSLSLAVHLASLPCPPLARAARHWLGLHRPDLAAECDAHCRQQQPAAHHPAFPPPSPSLPRKEPQERQRIVPAGRSIPRNAIQRGGSAAVRVVRETLKRLGWNPDQTREALPLLGEALRYVRGPLWREVMTVIVQWAERHPEDEALVKQAAPELKWCEAAEGGP
jgi:hypothetical protein